MIKTGKIRYLPDIKKYTPPGHTGTSNARLIEKTFCENFEMIHGTIEPGCGAHRHSHDVHSQVCYVLEGEMEVSFDDNNPEYCGPGAVVEIPPKVEHLIIVIYSPPLPPRGDIPIDC
jgi:quercetin dioxygenase-like cupin family protein